MEEKDEGELTDRKGKKKKKKEGLIVKRKFNEFNSSETRRSMLHNYILFFGMRWLLCWFSFIGYVCVYTCRYCHILYPVYPYILQIIELKTFQYWIVVEVEWIKAT